MQYKHVLHMQSHINLPDKITQLRLTAFNNVKTCLYDT